MTLQNLTDGASGLVVSRNFVEAEDIADALRRSGFANVQHCRNVRAALDALAEPNAALAVAFLSFDGNDDQVEVLLALLHKAEAHTVLIGDDPTLAENLGTAFLRRPFSNRDLDRCIERVRPVP
ncbi:hypothetical protein [uncultured Tateyamaria sp.]|uniref:hypothetical protein n=1 Tax=uncultured Tateyamaria sp. TaxID=455651 RepID=UPI00260495B2|nr:hypothetical protein [uncultured Tateyamaria sp.]